MHRNREERNKTLSVAGACRRQVAASPLSFFSLLLLPIEADKIINLLDKIFSARDALESLAGLAG